MMALAGVSVRLSSAAVGCCWALAAVHAKAAHVASPSNSGFFIRPPAPAVYARDRETLQATSLQLEAEHVAGFHEELAAVVEETVAGVGHVSGETSGGAYYVEIL